MIGRNLIPALMRDIIENHNVRSAKDLQDVLQDLMGSALESMLDSELDEELGYEKNQDVDGITDNRRNGYSTKKVRSSLGEVQIDVPRDRKGEYEPQVVEKRQKDISDIEERIIKMYTRGMRVFVN